MTQERAAALLRAILGSLRRWEDEAAELAAVCPAAEHLAVGIKQARLSLSALLERDAAGS
jgi:hypothetical protein